MADKKSREVVRTGEDKYRHYDEYSDGTRESSISADGCGRDDCYRDCAGECRKDNGKTVGEISVKVDVDVSEALTGLKAVQREARATTQALRELEDVSASDREIDRLVKFILANYPDEPGSVGDSESAVDVAIRLISTDHDLTEVPTKQLHEELAKREGVKEYFVGPHGTEATLHIHGSNHGTLTPIKGPARILINKD